MNSFKYKTLFKAISDQADLPDNAVIADLGCKNATFLLAFQEAFLDKIKSAVGVDITDKRFKDVEYNKPIELKVMNCAEKLEFPDSSFDFVFSKDMFECVSDKDFLVSEIYRILKPGGTVICVNCDWDSVAYNGENKALISKAVHAYAVTKQPWMDDLDSWIGRRMFGFFNKTGLFESTVSVHNVVETEYKEGTFGYDLSVDIAWLHKENTGALSQKEYAEFINNLNSAQKEGQYIFSKPYYIYKGIKRI
ncbi:MAG: methyltransferase domain-containing protein [Clostridia bacterium]|nr:methyltransferase domain-containing protein [Clostridia bacterium]MBR6634564.1 methyltransferase domain-containing protein [Clostridia bacterium]